MPLQFWYNFGTNHFHQADSTKKSTKKSLNLDPAYWFLILICPRQVKNVITEVSMRVLVRVCACVCACLCAYVCVCVCVCVGVYELYIYIYIYRCICIHIEAYLFAYCKSQVNERPGEEKLNKKIFCAKRFFGSG